MRTTQAIALGTILLSAAVGLALACRDRPLVAERGRGPGAFPASALSSPDFEDGAVNPK